MRTAIKPAHFPWYDYWRYTFSLGLKVGSRILLSGPYGVGTRSAIADLLSYWVREKQAVTLEEAMRMLSFIPAYQWGLTGRGLLREGYAADAIVFDPDTIGPMLPILDHDLPAGARRLKQKAAGLMATVVNGEVVLRNNEHTGALPGKLLRGPLARR